MIEGSVTSADIMKQAFDCGDLETEVNSEPLEDGSPKVSSVDFISD